jgi:DNA polymerase-3 subunit alpha
LAVLENLDRLLAVSGSHFRAKEVGQLTMFGAGTGVREKFELPPATQEVSRRQQLGWEKELLGLYVSDHPLTPLMDDLTQIVSHFSAELGDVDQGQSVCVAGMVTHVRPYQTRSGKPMGFVSLEDLQGSLELVIFSRTWNEVVDWLAPDKVVVVKGKVDRERGDPKILVDEITTEVRTVQSIESPPGGRERPSSPQPASRHGAGVPRNGATANGGAADSSHTRQAEDLPTVEPKLDTPPSISGGALSADAALGPNSPRKATVAPVKLHVATAVIENGMGPNGRRKVTVVLESTGDPDRDARRMRRVHGLLTSFPGEDRFAFHVHESSRQYLLEFPSLTTGLCDELILQLQGILGENTIHVEFTTL